MGAFAHTAIVIRSAQEEFVAGNDCRDFADASQEMLVEVFAEQAANNKSQLYTTEPRRTSIGAHPTQPYVCVVKPDAKAEAIFTRNL